MLRVVGAGNGKEQRTDGDTVGWELRGSSMGLIELLGSYPMVIFLKDFVSYTNAITQGAAILLTCSWEPMKIIGMICSLRVELGVDIRLQQMMSYKYESFVIADQLRGKQVSDTE